MRELVETSEKMNAHPGQARGYMIYRQIFLTYLRRKLLWFAVFMLIPGIGFFVDSVDRACSPIHASYSYSGPNDEAQIQKVVDEAVRKVTLEKSNRSIRDMTFSLFWFSWFLGIVMIHLKQQIASPAATLVPNYRRPHLIVAAALVLPVMIFVPFVMSMSISIPPLPFFAVASLWFTLVLWMCYSNSGILSIVLITFVFGHSFSGFTPWGHRFYHDLFTSSAVGLPLILIAVAYLALIHLARQLLILREEMPEYHRSIPTNQFQRLASPQPFPTEAFRTNYNNPVNRLIQSRSQRVLARFAESPPTTLFRQLQRWQITNYSTVFLWFLPLILLLQLIATHFIASSRPILPLLTQLVLFTAIGLAQYSIFPWQTLGTESLRPISRKNYLLQRAAAIALQMAQLWLVLALTFILATAFIQPDLLTTAKCWLTLAATAIVQIPIFAIFVWFLRYRSLWPLVVVCCLAGLFTVPVLIVSGPIRLLTLPELLILATIIILASALILRDAYRRWLTTDLA